MTDILQKLLQGTVEATVKSDLVEGELGFSNDSEFERLTYRLKNSGGPALYESILSKTWMAKTDSIFKGGTGSGADAIAVDTTDYLLLAATNVQDMMTEIDALVNDFNIAGVAFLANTQTFTGINTFDNNVIIGNGSILGFENTVADTQFNIQNTGLTTENFLQLGTAVSINETSGNTNILNRLNFGTLVDGSEDIYIDSSGGDLNINNGTLDKDLNIFADNGNTIVRMYSGTLASSGILFQDSTGTTEIYGGFDLKMYSSQFTISGPLLSSDPAIVNLINPDTTITAADISFGEFNFVSSDISTNSAGTFARIAAVSNAAFDGTVTPGMNIVFQTAQTDAAGLFDAFKILANRDSEFYGDVGISGKTGVGTLTPSSQFTVIGGTGPSNGVTIQNIETDATNKSASMKTGHYTNAEEPIAVWLLDSTSSSSTVRFGGSSSSHNSLTEISMWAAANSTTVVGTKIQTININGITVNSGDFTVEDAGLIKLQNDAEDYTVDLSNTGPTTESLLNIVSTNGVQIQDIETDVTTKSAFIKMGHYTNAEEPVNLIRGDSASSFSLLDLGGGHSLANSITLGRGSAAATTTTLGSTPIFEWDINGLNVVSGEFTCVGDVRSDTAFNLNGTDGIGAIGGTTYTFGGGGTGDIATMTFRGGILTAVTTVP